MDQLIDEAARVVPAEALTTVEIGLERTADWQDLKYARLYLQRLGPIVEADKRHGAGRSAALTAEAARRLALWMAYEDLVRVADLKTRGDRFAKVRGEVGAKDHEPIRTTEFLKPGVDEVAAMLPGFLARPLKRTADRRGWTHRLHVPMHLQSSSISGFTLMWLLARTRKLRRIGSRYGAEQQAIDTWLDAVAKAAARSYDFALEVARLPRLIKGYSDTFRRGWGNFHAIFGALVAPVLDDAEADLDAATARLSEARQAALADPDGAKLAELVQPKPAEPSLAAQ
jgi:indolepyruvate ferredoxin oxidoreductase beta subunit